MPALKSTIKLALVIAGSFLFSGNVADGQQTPSKIYKPVPSSSVQAAPPSVHVPPQTTQPLSPNGRAVPQHRPVRSKTGVGFSFSDHTTPPTTNFRGQPRPRSLSDQRNTVRQTSYQASEKPTDVPAILTDPAQQKLGSQLKRPHEIAPTIPSTRQARKTPEDFAAAMRHASTQTPRVDATALLPAQEDISSKMEALRRQVEAREKEKASLAATQSETTFSPVPKLPDPVEPKQTPLRIQAQQPITAQQPIEAQRQAASQAAAARQSIENQTAQRVAAMPATNKTVSASEFIGRISTETKVATQATKQPAVEKLLAQPMVEQPAVPAVMKLTTNAPSAERPNPIRDDLVRPVSSQSDIKDATIKLAAPAIQVESYGPQIVGVNKPANYRFIVRNNSPLEAEQILVGINLPQWVDIENVNMTTGDKEVTDGKQKARLIWKIDRIPANTTQTINITAVPRKAEMFDVGVEWTLVPRTGKTNITVTEPRLEINIGGPSEILYGETATYQVTVRNPGTGVAENVIIMLPESFGGARAAIGNIEANEEKVYEVELLARSAGEMTLITNASADGQLTAKAEQNLVVRRANLKIGMKGPGLKYSGSVAQYVVSITNDGDATAHGITSAVALPPGVKFIGGIESVNRIKGGINWSVGSLEPGQTRTYKVNCELNTSGDLQLEVGARDQGDLAASSACLTTVETIADLVLTVADPKGPLPTGEQVPYEIKIQNRGSRAAKGVNLVMQFSEGIEPVKATGIKNKIAPGQVLFSQIEQISPGQELVFHVNAEARKSGTHRFRAQLTADDSDVREIAEGTTRFFGETVQSSSTPTQTADSNSFGGGDFKK